MYVGIEYIAQKPDFPVLVTRFLIQIIAYIYNNNTYNLVNKVCIM